MVNQEVQPTGRNRLPRLLTKSMDLPAAHLESKKGGSVSLVRWRWSQTATNCISQHNIGWSTSFGDQLRTLFYGGH